MFEVVLPDAELATNTVPSVDGTLSLRPS
jgi:hypothetical protein